MRAGEKREVVEGGVGGEYSRKPLKFDGGCFSVSNIVGEEEEGGSSSGRCRKMISAQVHIKARRDEQSVISNGGSRASWMRICGE